MLYEELSRKVLVVVGYFADLAVNRKIIIEIKKTPDSLGLLLVRRLTEQLSGAFRLYTDNGMVASVCFSSQ